MEPLQDDNSTVTAASPTPPANRLVYIFGRHKFGSNAITTAKYNFASFLPKFLFEQFRRYANIFFLFIALMQQIPNVSPTGRYTTAVPLICILTVSAVKEIFEDIKRHKADRSVNRTLVWVLNKVTCQWEWKCWRDVHVGDIVKCSNEHFFPADLLLISSCEPNGMCYTETANLDGETNLKIRQSLSVTANCLTCEQLVQDLNLASIECDAPNRHLYEFNGNLKIEDKLYSVGPENILLRGAKLKNTNWVFGCVLYTGHETKLMMNSAVQAPLKRSNVDRVTNSQILLLFGILLGICAVSAIASQIWNYDNKHWYLITDDIFSTNFFFSFLTFMILYNNLIPISLQVTLELVRFIQAQFINADLEMYCEESDTPAMARTSNLNEELGQVRYILTDKTGTLTKNVMEFKKCSIAGTIFEEEDFETMSQIIKNNQPQAHYLREFLTLLSVCQTVVPESGQEDITEDGTTLIKYQAASPDEGALVRGAQRIGYEFTTRTPQYVFINAMGREERYEILNVLEFTSDRKRMSVIVRCPDGRIKLYIKGADSVIYERLESEQFCDVTLEHLSKFAVDGLRTLCCALTEIDEITYNEWNGKYMATLTSSIGSGVSREDKLAEILSQIEVNLSLIGATAIEDKLQDEVPETIDTLLRAGIKVWVLTGDKQETAINIGHSCKLIHSGSPLIIINEESLDATREAICETEATCDHSLIIDGKSLIYALTPDVRKEFLSIALKCKSVICCRVSPAQKAEIVEMVKNSTRMITLAIGDGANDVAMIRAANVGVGISGHEGLQAVHSADYAIAQFRFLKRLLLVHGSWSLSRLVKLILYSFYKNIALYVIELWFATVSAWSGQTIFERWTIGLYNVIFTAFPPLAIGLFDRQCTAETMLKYPTLYKSHIDSFNVKLFWIWIGSAIWHSLMLFWLTYYSVANDTLWSHGKADGGYLVFGNMLYTYVVVTVCLKAGLEISSWTYLTHAAIWGSILSWFAFLIFYSHFWSMFHLFAADMVAMDHLVFSSGVFWAGLVIIPFMTLLIDVVYKIVSRTCYKTQADEIIELELSNSPSQQTMLTETARLIKSVFDTKKRKRLRIPRGKPDVEIDLQHGYAFSQEEHGVVSQSELIRAYDTTKHKPSGV